MPESFEVEAIIPAGPERIYAAWLDAKEHGAFTGAPAMVEAWVGGRFTAHDGYLHGITLQLEPGKRIVQSWRSTEFPQGTPDSKIYLDLERVSGGTRLRIKHVDVPMGHTKLYKPGWLQRYFKPMMKYFAPKPPKEKAVKAKPAPAAAAKRPMAAPAKRPAAAAKPGRPAAKPSRPAAKPSRPAAGKRPAPRRAKVRKPARSAPARRGSAAKSRRPAPKKTKASPKKAARKGRR